MRGQVIITDDRAKLMLTFLPQSPGAQYKSAGGSSPDLVGSSRVPRPASAAGSSRSTRVPAAARGPAQRRPHLRAGRRVRHRADPGLPGQRQGELVGYRQVDPTILETLDTGEDPLPVELRERYGLYGRAGPSRAIHRPGLGGPQARRRPAQVDEAFMLQAALAQRRMAAAACWRCRGRTCRTASPTSSTPGCRSPSPRARWPWGRPSRTRPPGLRLPDAPAAAGRGRLGQDGDRDPRHAPGGRRGRPGRAAGPHRSPGPAA